LITLLRPFLLFSSLAISPSCHVLDRLSPLSVTTVEFQVRRPVRSTLSLAVVRMIGTSTLLPGRPMASAPTTDTGPTLQGFCATNIANTWEYAYLGALQEWLDYRYPTNRFPVLHTLAEQGKVFKMLSKKAVKRTRGSQYMSKAHWF
jgi:hypothetical protein